MIAGELGSFSRIVAFSDFRFSAKPLFLNTDHSLSVKVYLNLQDSPSFLMDGSLFPDRTRHPSANSSLL